jgi:L-ascorbate metabolism protein UlaG (beta-lactamase superfamily)
LTLNIRWWRNLALGLLAIGLLIVYVVWRQWQTRGSLEDIDWSSAMVALEPGEAVTATWLGTTTILFDDGETQVLIDGTFTRVNPISVILSLPIKSDIANINYALSTFRINRLAAIVPVDSHFDHAIDIGHIANRTSAVVLGSESTANVARGEDVPVDQYQILDDGESRQFGDFMIKLIASRHAPINDGDEEYFPGLIGLPVRQPARVSEWKTGVTWSIIIGHPRGNTLVQGSGGFLQDKLADESVDVVMLSIAKLAGLGREYVDTLWQETVVATDAARVIAIHHDDYTQPFGEVKLLPDMLDNVDKTTVWLEEIRTSTVPETTLELPPFGQPMILY